MLFRSLSVLTPQRDRLSGVQTDGLLVNAFDVAQVGHIAFVDAYKSVLLQLFRDFSDASGETVLSLRCVQHYRPLEGLEIEDGVVWYLHEAGTACERDIAGRGFPGLEQVSDVVKEKLFVHGFEQVTRGLNRVSLQGILGRSRDEKQG